MAWRLVRRQHGVVSYAQLRALGYSRHAIAHRIATGRLHPLFRGVYAVGRREVGWLGMWMAAVLAGGEGAVLSHESAGQLLGFWPRKGPAIHVSVPARRGPAPAGIEVHRRKALRPEDLGSAEGIPVTSPACTLADLAARHGRGAVERAVNEADARAVIAVPELHAALERMPRRPGAGALRAILAPGAFVLTRSELERRFVQIARAAGLGEPQTQVEVDGFVVDFYFPEHDLVVETDGGTFHRTPGQQTRDRLREHAHARAERAHLRFTHHQVVRERTHVVATLRKVTGRLAAARGPDARTPPRWQRGHAACA